MNLSTSITFLVVEVFFCSELIWIKQNIRTSGGNSIPPEAKSYNISLIEVVFL